MPPKHCATAPHAAVAARRRAGWVVLLALLAGPGAALEGRALLVDGRSAYLTDITVRADGPGYRFSARTHPPAFEDILQIEVAPLERGWVASRPADTEWFGLGTAASPIPPPPDWMREFGQPAWSATGPCTRTTQLPLLPEAVYAWAGRERPDGDDLARVLLIRAALDCGSPERLARARLWLATNGDPLEAAFNGYPLHLAGRTSGFALAAFEVTPQMLKGRNVVALRVREQTRWAAAAHGFACALELSRRPTGAPGAERDPLAALMLLGERDRAWGRVVELRGNGVELATVHGRQTFAWRGARGLIFPAGWRPWTPPPSLLDRLLANTPPEATDLQWHGLPTRLRPGSLADRLLLTDGRVTEARPRYVRAGVLFFEGPAGEEYRLPMRDVLAVMPRVSAEDVARRLQRPGDRALFARLELLNGERYSGVIDRLGGTARLTRSDGALLEFDADRIARVEFPLHTGAPADRPPRRLGLMPRWPGLDEAYAPPYERARQAAALAALAVAEVGLQELSPATLAGDEQLTPRRWPVLVCVDPLGEYLHTWAEPADAVRALADYLREGGWLVALSPGGALRTAVKREGEGYARTLARPNLLDELGLTIARSGRATTATATADSALPGPDDAGAAWAFARIEQAPSGLEGLPVRFAPTPAIRAPFAPMLGPDGVTRVIYRLNGGGGSPDPSRGGPALSIINVGRGGIVVIDQILWAAEADGRPFTETALPLLLRWAAGR